MRTASRDTIGRIFNIVNTAKNKAAMEDAPILNLYSINVGGVYINENVNSFKMCAELSDIMLEEYLNKFSKMSKNEINDFVKKLGIVNKEQMSTYIKFFNEVRKNGQKGIVSNLFSKKSRESLLSDARQLEIDRIAMFQKGEFLQYEGPKQNLEKKIYLNLSPEDRLLFSKEFIKEQNNLGCDVTFKMTLPNVERDDNSVIYCTEDNYEKVIEMITNVKNKNPKIFENSKQVGYFTDFSSGFMSIGDKDTFNTSFNKVRAKSVEKTLELTLIEQAQSIISDNKNVFYENTQMDLESALYYTMRKRFSHSPALARLNEEEYNKTINQYAKQVLITIMEGESNEAYQETVAGSLLSLYDTIRNSNVKIFDENLIKNFEIIADKTNIDAKEIYKNLDNTLIYKGKNALNNAIDISVNDLKSIKEKQRKNDYREEMIKRAKEQEVNQENYINDFNAAFSMRLKNENFDRNVPSLDSNVNLNTTQNQSHTFTAGRNIEKSRNKRTIVATRENNGKVSSKYIFEIDDTNVTIYKNGKVVGVNDINKFMANNGFNCSNDLEQNVDTIMRGVNQNFIIERTNGELISTLLNCRKVVPDEKLYTFSSNHNKEYNIAIEGNIVKAARMGERLNDMNIVEFARCNNIDIDFSKEINSEYIMQELATHQQILLSYTDNNNKLLYLNVEVGIPPQEQLNDYILDVGGIGMKVKMGMDDITIFDTEGRVAGIEDRKSFCENNGINICGLGYGNLQKEIIPSNEEIAANLIDNQRMIYVDANCNNSVVCVDDVLPTLPEIENEYEYEER